MSDYYALAEIKIREALRQAEQARLVHLAEAANAGRPWYAGLLASLGARFTTWGAKLEQRFSESPQQVTFLPAQH